MWYGTTTMVKAFCCLDYKSITETNAKAQGMKNETLKRRRPVYEGVVRVDSVTVVKKIVLG